LQEKDYIDVYTYLVHKYGSIKSVSDEFGIPYSEVAQYVKFDQLIPELKKMVEKDEVQFQTALRAQRIATRNDMVEDKTAIALAGEMKNMARAQQRQLEKIAAEMHDATVDEILSACRERSKVKRKQEIGS
jgi:adenine C2-methylase RlmN of 23S rRNA A2503 and tRNA A37